MPSLQFSKSTLGAIIDVLVVPSALGTEQLRLAGRAPPAPLRIKMLVDTGAERTAIDEASLDAWTLPYVSLGWARTLVGIKPIRSYELDITLSAQSSFWKVEALEVMARREPFVGSPYHGLVGRDILDQALFTYDGPKHRCSLEFDD